MNSNLDQSTKKIVSTRILNECKIVQYDDGSEWISPIEQPKPVIEVDDRSWWQKVCDWWNDTPVKPYVRIKDMSDPFGDKHYEGGTKKAVEVGIKIDF